MVNESQRTQVGQETKQKVAAGRGAEWALWRAPDAEEHNAMEKVVTEFGATRG